MDIVLIRHTSVGVPKGTCYGWSDVPVADSFEKEAAETRMNLKDDTFDAVFSSPLTRAAKLAAFCGYDKPIIDERLKEMNMGTWEMQQFDNIRDERLQAWYDDYLNQPATGGESFRDLYTRVAAFLDELRQQPCRRAAIFAHGGVLICARVYAGEVSAEQGFRNLTPYGGMVKITL